MSIIDVNRISRQINQNKIWCRAGQRKLICPQDATAHILALATSDHQPELAIHCDIRFLFREVAGEFSVNEQTIRLLEIAERAGRKIIPFDWLNSKRRRVAELKELKPTWETITGQQFLWEIKDRARGKKNKAELAITSKCFGTSKAHITVAINPPMLKN